MYNRGIRYYFQIIPYGIRSLQYPFLLYIKHVAYSLTVINMNFNFGNRKIQKVRYSHLVPLPALWVKSMNIGKGNSLKIEMQDDHSLRVTPVLQARQDSEGTGSTTPAN